MVISVNNVHLHPGYSTTIGNDVESDVVVEYQFWSVTINKIHSPFSFVIYVKDISSKSSHQMKFGCSPAAVV